MDKLSELRTALLDILHETGTADLRIIVGGGYGIYLKREYIKETGVPTVLVELPEARATNDLDLFLRPELLIKAEKLRPLKEAIDALGYKVIPTAAKYQFVKNANGPGTIKIDLLTGPRERFRGTGVRTKDGRRAKPAKSIGIHARLVNEAPTLEEGLRAYRLKGQLTSGQNFESDVWIPHPFTYLLMKLFAFRDRFNDVEKDTGSYHALDLYTILATITEDEWEQALKMASDWADSEAFREAKRIVEEYFSQEAGLGILRLKESRYYEERLDAKEFISSLQEIFTSGRE